ncbi:MAG: hypothetical protein PHU71_03540 [Candidatus Gracilibacteria bacterium]|nr:hypothetical protein [Candidatus Gracilibacteria bacterium]
MREKPRKNIRPFLPDVQSQAPEQRIKRDAEEILRKLIEPTENFSFYQGDILDEFYNKYSSTLALKIISLAEFPIEVIYGNNRRDNLHKFPPPKARNLLQEIFGLAKESSRKKYRYRLEIKEIKDKQGKTHHLGYEVLLLDS